MWKLLLLAVTCASVYVASGQASDESCAPIETARYVVAKCTNGNNTGSRCQLSCEDGYQLAEGSGSKQVCVCRKNKCKWKGKAATCVLETNEPKKCDRPDYMRATYGVAETSPGGAIFRLTIRPSEDTTDGWSVALVLHRALPETVEFESAHVKLRATSEDRKVYTFNSRGFNKDLSALQAFAFHVVVSGLDKDSDAAIYTALAGFFPKKIADAACIQSVSPIRPLPNTTPGPTVRPRPITTPGTTRPPTVVTDGLTLDADCEVLSNDGTEAGYLVLNPGRNDGSRYVYTSRAQKFGDDRSLENWQMKIEFTRSVESMRVFVADAFGPYDEGRVWILKPKPFNINPTRLQILMMVTASAGEAAPNAVVTFCRNGAEPDQVATGTVPSSGGGPNPVVTVPPTQRPTATPFPTNDARCAATEPFGELPDRSEQTDPSDFVPSPFTADTTYDYNEVLHLSLLFYEAQRSGELPADNRIGWRGDSGLKDGCEVALDLSKGYYDAGDNVKFGFPMAWTITTVAWGLIEFREAYAAAEEYERALAMIKWGTDYFIEAHPSPNVFFAQVGDAQADHDRWERPEDGTRMRRLYALNTRAGGSEVAAETAAALAAASILFRDHDPDYSEELLEHARQLYTFADTYRVQYHRSVPGVDKFYKSWSGFNDELLWAAAWLYKATEEEQFLNEVRSRYSNFGAANTPPEYSWDNKYAGVQVLMAEFIPSDSERYRGDVIRFMESAMAIAKTPSGMTWKQKWGPNRYAANFAAIAMMAANLDPPLQHQQRYVEYAKNQINYLLGDNEISRSYVVGFGRNPPRSPHHRASSCPNWRSTPVPPCNFDALNRQQPNPHVLFGALVGGPDLQGNYNDDRKDYVSNEVATDYNAGFQTAVAGLQQFAMQGDLP